MAKCRCCDNRVTFWGSGADLDGPYVLLRTQRGDDSLPVDVELTPDDARSLAATLTESASRAEGYAK